jgi:hypothetical protein
MVRFVVNTVPFVEMELNPFCEGSTESVYSADADNTGSNAPCAKVIPQDWIEGFSRWMRISKLFCSARVMQSRMLMEKVAFVPAPATLLADVAAGIAAFVAVSVAFVVEAAALVEVIVVFDASSAWAMTPAQTRQRALRRIKWRIGLFIAEWLKMMPEAAAKSMRLVGCF